MGVVASMIARREARKAAAAGGKGGPGGGIGKITGLGVAGAAFDGISTYAMNRMDDPNGSKGVDMLQAGGTAAAWLFAEPLMWGITLGQGAAELGKAAYKESEENRRQWQDIQNHVVQDRTGSNAGTIGGNFQDTEMAATMRQRQMDILRQHKISTEAALGSEARQLHR